MNIFPKLKNKFKLLSIAFILSFTIFGCSQNLPEIYETRHSVVFTYNDYESLPEARLSVFLETTSDPRRCERVEIHSLEADYLWNTCTIMKIANSERKWSGNVNFVVPAGEKIPKGIYELKYISADESEDTVTFAVKYDDKLYELTGNDFLKFIGDSGKLDIAIYDNSRVLIYMGEKTEELSTKGDIFNTYNEAVYYQDIWFNDDNSVICILPENKL